MNNYYDSSSFAGNAIPYTHPMPTFQQPPMNWMGTVPNYDMSRMAAPMFPPNPPMPRNTSFLRSLLGGGSRGAASAVNAATGAATATKGITFNGLLNGASKTLGVINQAIPVIYQVKPIWNNAKTMFRVMKAVNQEDTPVKKESQTTNETVSNQNDANSSANAPTFFA